VSQKLLEGPPSTSPDGPADRRDTSDARDRSDAPRPSPASALSSALRGFVETLQQQTARHTDIIDVFARALKEMNRELKLEKTRREIMERHVQEAESRIARLERTLAALARQGWVH
jgi:septal ring factor EnvC (AmiA/AmiB activator)